MRWVVILLGYIPSLVIAQNITDATFYKVPPKSKGQHLILKDYPELRTGILSFFDTLGKDHGYDIVELGIPLGGFLVRRYFAVFSPSIAKNILNYKGDALIKGAAADAFKKTIFYPEGIIFLEDNIRWELLNKAFREGPFHPRYFSELYGAVFALHVRNLLKRWQRLSQGNCFELYDEIIHFTMSVMSEGFFHYRLTENELKQLVSAFKFILDDIQARELEVFSTPRFLPTSTNLKFKKCSEIFKNLLRKIIAHDPGYVEVGGEKLPSIISILKQHRDPDTQKPLTEDEILSHIGALFFAGHDTTANLITMLIYKIWSSPEDLQTLHQEIEKLDGRSIVWVPMGSLPYLDKVQQEVLRLYPSVPVISRDTTREMIVEGYRIPGGSTILIVPAMINKNPLYYKRPTVFNPLRMDPKNQDFHPRSTESFIPFGYGARHCIGQWFAQTEARSIVAQFLKAEVELELYPSQASPVKLKMTCTGIPNQEIFGRLTGVNRNFVRENTNMIIRDMPMEVIETRFENQSHSIQTFRLQSTNIDKFLVRYNVGDHLTAFTQTSHGLICRHYTISSSPTQGEDWLEVTVKRENKGVVSPQLHDKWQPGSMVRVRLAFDDGIRLDDEDCSPIVLISGGVGITPMIAIARYLIDSHSNRAIYFIHSARDRRSLSFYDLATYWSDKNQKFSHHLTLTQEPGDSLWQGNRGRIDAQTISSNIGIETLKKAQIFICGSQNMVADINQGLSKMGVANQQVTHLSFGQLIQNGICYDIKMKEVEMHKKPSDAWIVLGGKVFDITNYLLQHPGLDVLNQYLGKDATDAFYKIPHSNRAIKELVNHPNIVFLGFLYNDLKAFTATKD